MRHTLTIVVPTCNRPGLLMEALASIAEQSVLPHQVVIVDDASQPALEHHRISSLLPNVDVQYVVHPARRGGWATKNSGAFAASGSLITFLDDDDKVKPDFTKNILEAFSSQPDFDVMFVAVEAFGVHAPKLNAAQRQALSDLKLGTTWSQGAAGAKIFTDGLFDYLLRSVPMAFQRPVVRRDKFVQMGGFRQYRTWWEGEWAIRAASALKVGLLDIELHEWRVSDQGMFTRKDSKRQMLEVELEIKKAILGDISDPQQVRSVKQAIYAAYMDLASYVLLTELGVREASMFWIQAMKHHFDFRSIRRMVSSTARGLQSRITTRS